MTRPDNLPYTEKDVRDAFPIGTATRGERYARQDRVSNVIVSNAGSTIAAEVRGSRPAAYAVTAYATRRRGAQTRMTGYCDCPLGADCKHVAAAFFAALAIAEAPVRAARIAENVSDARIDRWLADVRESLSPGAGDPRAERDRVAYVFARQTPPSARGFGVKIAVVRRDADGRRQIENEMSVDALGYATAAFVTSSDAVIGRLLQVFGSAVRGRVALAEDIVRRMIATGFAFFEDVRGTALSLGPSEPAHIAWELAADGSQRATLAFGDSRILKLSAPIAWYVAPERGLAGPVDVGIATGAVQTLLDGPAIAADRVAQVRMAFATMLPDLALPTPLEISGRTEEVALVPTLRLRAVELPGLFSGGPIDVAEFSFAYGDALVYPRAGGRTIRHVARGEAITYARDTFAETIASKRLTIAGLDEDAALRTSVGAAGQVLRYSAGAAWQWSPFLHEVVPKLRADGWRVDVDASFTHRVIDLSRDDAWHPSAVDAGDGWFDLALGIEIDGTRYDLLPLLTGMVDAAVDETPRETYYVSPGDDRTTLALPYARVRAIVDTLVELHEPGAAGDGRLRFSKARASVVGDLEAASGLQWNSPERLRTLTERLRKSRGLERIPVPESFVGTLRPYQQDGLDWLQFLAANELGGLLADDMGLGKSVQTLAHLLCEKEAGRLTQPALLVVPTSLVYNWRDEAARFTPSLRVLSLHGPGRAKQFAEIDRCDVAITTYALLDRDRILHERTWHAVVLDEAQAIKNPLSKVARAAARLRASHRFCLTGTPVENNLGDLWSLFSVALPGLLGDRKLFNSVFRMPIEKRRDPARSRALQQRIAPFLLRRTKEAVATELPEKTEILQRVELTGAQRDLYETVRVAMSDRVQTEIADHGIARSQIVILDALLKLRQVCCDPRLLPERLRKEAESVKLDMLLEMLPQAIVDGRRVLVFSQFTSMLDLIAAALTASGIAYALLTGETKDRESVVKRFQAGDVPIFLISLKAGGTGLNLTAADTVIHYDPWWNPAVERQATDRAHRIGQTRPVFVYKLICAGTVEEKIVDLQSRKAELAAAIFSEGASVVAGFGSDDVARLFAPIGTT